MLSYHPVIAKYLEKINNQGENISAWLVNSLPIDFFSPLLTCQDNGLFSGDISF